MKWVVIIAAVLSLLAAACGGTDPPPEPDRVVGILLACEQRVAVGNRNLEVRPANGAECEEGSRQNIRLVLTIRTPEGTTYTVDVDRNTQVTAGDPWPP